MNRNHLISAVALLAPAIAGAQAAEKKPATFTVRIENVSTAQTLKLAAGGTAPAPTSPGAYAVHTGSNPFFTVGQPAGTTGLESQAEDGDPSTLAGYVQGVKSVRASGVFTTPKGDSEPGPLLPGKSFEFTFTARPGERLSLTMMFGQSNDAFIADAGKGIALFDIYGNPAGGDVTSQLVLWDAGTEVNEEPGSGPNQAPRQAAANTGPSEHEPVRAMRTVKDGFTWPAVATVVRVTVTARRNVASR